MGYFFRPQIYAIIHGDTELMKQIDKRMFFGDTYRLEWAARKEDGTRYQDPTWRSWGYFIHGGYNDRYKKFIDKIFTTSTDTPDDTYEGNTIWTRKYPENYGYFTDKVVLKLLKEFKSLIEGDDNIGWTWEDVRPQLVYILKGPWEHWVAW